ncbi:MAG: hypothetical protein JNL96_03640 [Planctomycetaceae bacterium]|nr:hypothetical protein [Planctomycetaceae bacterium]
MLNSRLLLKIALPMIALSLLLLAVGITAAWHVQRQQSESAALITREVHGLLAAEDLFATMREIRRELDLLLRTHSRKHLDAIDGFLKEARRHVDAVHAAARTDEEARLVVVVDEGLAHFLDEYQQLRALPESVEAERRYARLCDEILTNEVLAPARQCIEFNKQVVDKTIEAGNVTAQHMRMGFLLLGITGCAAGLLIGLSLARAVSRSIVRLDVSVRGVAGKLTEVGGPVRISHFGDAQGLEAGIRHVEQEITQVVRLYQQKEIELLRSEQLATVGQLAAGVAHELRNPLMPIKVLVQSTLDRPGEVSLSRRQLKIIDEELSRVEDTIQSFLDFARPPELVKTPLNVADVIYQAVDLVYPKTHQHEVELHCVVPADEIIALGDIRQLKQLLLNLMLNSLDVVTEGGLIQIVLESPSQIRLEQRLRRDRSAAPQADSEQDALHIAADAAEETPSCRIRISDTGPGFPPDVLPRIFVPFMTTKDTGTGLGLPICKQIIQAHGGEITAANRRPRGAEFCIVLPLRTPAAGRSNSRPERDEQPAVAAS